MCSVQDGLRMVPDLFVVESDMSRYRLVKEKTLLLFVFLAHQKKTKKAHRQLFDLLREMGLTPERASIDEAYLDLTPLLQVGEVDETRWKAEDVFVYGDKALDLENADDVFLARGVVVTSMIRQAIKDKMRFETSAGVSLNKSFAKYYLFVVLFRNNG
jgi:nucleotidyltransferase/DNA polymerase involved in DNA repair